MSVVSINSKEELQKVLALQKTISDTAVREILTYASLPPEQFLEGARTVLEKYARYATLTEFERVHSLVDSEKWGATFGVTAIIGTLMLEQARQLMHVQSDLRLHYLRFLAALDSNSGVSITMDALTRIFAVLSDSYGVIWVEEDAISLTVVGRRVYLHLLDGMKFIDEVAAATTQYLK